MSRWVDLHNHVLPGVDDGARDPGDAAAAVGALRGEGVAIVVATPHVDGSLTRDPDALAERLGQLDAAAATMAPADGVELRRGVELKLDVPEVDLSDARLRLGGSTAVLVEFPHMTVPPRSGQVLAAIRRAGYVPLLAHPERYEGVDAELSVVAAWIDAGAYLQVNASSLRGRYGERAQAIARGLLARGWIHCLASDFHARGEPGLADVRRLLEAWGGEEQARVLFETNPARLLADEPCHAVDPLRPASPLRRRIARLLPWT